MLEAKKMTEKIIKNSCNQVKKVEPGAQIRLRIEKRRDGRLWTEYAGKAVALRVQSCFPWSHTRQYISLRDEEENEVALIEDLSRLEPESRRLIEQALAEAGFVMEIESVISLNEEFEIRSWHVQTKQGPRKFQTKRDEWSQVISGGGLLFRDVAGDLFYIRQPHTMDPASRKLLAAFID